jgi:hypothetical protein
MFYKYEVNKCPDKNEALVKHPPAREHLRSEEHVMKNESRIRAEAIFQGKSAQFGCC